MGCRPAVRSWIPAVSGVAAPETVSSCLSAHEAVLLELVGGWPGERAVPQLRDRGAHPGKLRLPHRLRVLVLDAKDPRKLGHVRQDRPPEGVGGGDLRL